MSKNTSKSAKKRLKCIKSLTTADIYATIYPYSAVGNDSAASVRSITKLSYGLWRTIFWVNNLFISTNRRLQDAV